MSSPWEVEASNSSGTSEVPPADNHVAVLVALIDLGTHEEEYQNEKYDARKALFCWELPSEHKSDGSSFVVSQDFNLTPKVSGRSKLRQMLQSWRGRPMDDGERLDLQSLLGKPCLLNIGHGKSAKGNTYAKIMGISPLVKGMTAPKPFNEPYEWHLGAGPVRLPDWIPYIYGQSVEEYIGQCKELGGTGVKAGVNGSSPQTTGAPAAKSEDDEIPF